eukprot:2592708-Rhodomonas_salina.1
MVGEGEGAKEFEVEGGREREREGGVCVRGGRKGRDREKQVRGPYGMRGVHVGVGVSEGGVERKEFGSVVRGG